jgi:hypothetical protein
MTITDLVESSIATPTGKPSRSQTTRLMCAAAYLEGTFAQEVIDEVVEEPFRAVQVPEGVDVVPVVRHCLAARRHKDIRDFLLAGLLVLTGVVVAATGRAVFVVVGFLAAWATVVWDLWTATYHVAIRKLSATAFDPDDAPAASNPETAARLAELAARGHGNVTVYSGFNPFAGSGLDHGGWSFAMDMRKGREHLGELRSPVPFEVQELYGSVTSALEALMIDGLEVEDRLFVNGTDLRSDRLLLPKIVGRPVSAVNDRDLDQFISHPTHRVRPYKCVRVVDWQGDLVVSLFLRFSLDNGRLFTELSRFLLTPVKAEYRRVDGIDPDLTVRQALSIVGRALRLTVPLWLRSPAPMLRPLVQMRREARRLRRVKGDLLFDYGAPMTALDRARSTEYTRYFQKLDREMYIKVLERTILDVIVDFLDCHDIDTSELSERRETIINNGIMVPGGSVQAHNVAVGQGAGILSRLRTSAPATSAPPQAS